MDASGVPETATRIAEQYGRHPHVVAVAMGGSRSTGMADLGSDIDLYVYTAADLGLPARRQIASSGSTRQEIGNQFWEPGDEWLEPDSTHLDVMFRRTDWIEEQLARVLDRHEASVGYSTCFWANVHCSRPIVDREGWFARLQKRADVHYPEKLRSAIIAKNWPLLRHNLSSYRRQLDHASERRDLVGVQHRVTAALASYFDILLALNRQPHPGEKRLLAFVERLCPLRPPTCLEQIESLVNARGAGVLQAYDVVMDGLDAILAAEGFPVDAQPESIAPAGAIAHVALWTSDLEKSRAFYERYFGAVAGPLYRSARRPLASYFLRFPSGPELELMQEPESPSGWAHVALNLGSRQRVDDLTAQLKHLGVRVLSEPRQTGDGYYESVVEDPDGNPLELTATQASGLAGIR